jgi:protein-S-isoprenylcysteine O-methyltransferase Ste14
MRSLGYVSPYCWFFWVAFVLAFAPEFLLISRSTPAPGDGTDRGSLKVIVFCNGAGMFIAFFVSNLTQFSIARGQKIWFGVGLAVLLLGSLLRRHCFHMLGRHFTGDVRASVDQPVIQSGAYSLVRHPSYTGGIMMFAGVGLALTNWLSLVVVMLLNIPAYFYRVRVEEQALQETVGQPYRQYMTRTKRFIPFLF